MRDTARSPEREARVVNHNAEFDSSCPLAEQAVYITRKNLDRCDRCPCAILRSVFTHDLGQESPIQASCSVNKSKQKNMIIIGLPYFMFHEIFSAR